ncbi:MAG: helix-turn-helix domain-containing protein [Deltaproteobacteria bacterium]|nr:helix-turn-helix domain-containing protein [Deltaproteobacteria bacterium]
MNIEQLTEKEISLIRCLGESGSMTLSEVSAKTLTPPSQMLTITEMLQRAGYLESAPVEAGIENKAYFLNSRGRKLWAAL